MFRQMRRKNKLIDETEVIKLLETERRGVLAVNGDDGYPYAVPLNYFYDRESGKIYFHGSRIGHKAESLQKDDRVCFTVYGNETIKDETWAPYMQSAVIFGRCRLLECGEESTKRLKSFASKYFPNMELVEEENDKSGRAAQMYEISIEHITGKQIQER